MGRAMLIIVSGILVMMGYMGVSVSQQGKRIAQSNSGYANNVKARLGAMTAVQIAMNEINQDPDWDDNNATEANPWNTNIDGVDISLYVEELSTPGGGLLQVDTLRIVSKGNYYDEEKEIINVYKKEALHYVPKFKSAISFATNNFNFNMDGSADINGNDETGQCPDMPGISTMNDSDSSMVSDNGGASYLEGNPKVTVDDELTYSPVDELIARLETMAGVQHISGEYKGDMGTETDPGVYFVEDQANLTGGISEGYGIMVIRSDGELEYDGSLDVAGNFTFNGLVIFENAWDFDGQGTPTINGSVLAGNTQNTSPLQVDLTGNIKIQYDCTAEYYAQLASANLLKQNRYTRMSSFE